MVKIIVACGSGMGSSQMMKMKVQKVLGSMGVNATLHHTNIGEAKSTAEQYDVVICPDNLAGTFSALAAKGKVIVSLKNLLDENEIKSKLVAAGVASL
ncbi:MAG: PTS sugar transporter subunit IIB [Treponema sp.]|nr:PTS sugar transporter subunit IIB [Treponema sp.]